MGTVCQEVAFATSPSFLSLYNNMGIETKSFFLLSIFLRGGYRDLCWARRFVCIVLVRNGIQCKIQNNQKTYTDQAICDFHTYILARIEYRTFCGTIAWSGISRQWSGTKMPLKTFRDSEKVRGTFARPCQTFCNCREAKWRQGVQHL